MEITEEAIRNGEQIVVAKIGAKELKVRPLPMNDADNFLREHGERLRQLENRLQSLRQRPDREEMIRGLEKRIQLVSEQPNREDVVENLKSELAELLSAPDDHTQIMDCRREYSEAVLDALCAFAPATFTPEIRIQLTTGQALAAMQTILSVTDPLSVGGVLAMAHAAAVRNRLK